MTITSKYINLLLEQFDYDQLVALKELLSEKSDDEDYSEFFERILASIEERI